MIGGSLFSRSERVSETTTDSRRLGVIRLALWAGLAVGVGELVLLGAMEFLLDRYLWYISAQSTWMVPLANVILFGTLGLILAGAHRLWPGVVSIPIVAGVLAFFGFVALGFHLDERIHDAAILVFAAGLAVQVSRLIARGPVVFERLVRATAPVLVAGVVLLAVFAEGRPLLRERAETAALPAAAEDAPNVLLIVWDTVRGHSLCPCTPDRVTTPELTRLAERGVRFDQAISTASWTLPAHASLFTGLYPNELDVGYTQPLDDDELTLAEALRDRGYATGGFVANFGAAGWESGLGRGFIRYDDFPRSWGQLFVSARLVRSGLRIAGVRQLLGFKNILGRKGAPSVSRGFLDWQAEVEGRPFFAFLNYYDAHAPYLPPPQFANRIGGPRSSGDPLLIERMNEIGGWTPEQIREELDAYEGSVAYLDAHFGELMDELERRGVLDNTIVIVTSDHGEEFGEHAMLGHGDELFAPLIRIPLVLSMPGRVPEGLTIQQPASLKDVASTVLDLIEPGPSSTFPGASLARYWRGSPTAFATTTDVPGVDDRWETELDEPIYSYDAGLISIVLGRYHYLRRADGTEQLFDMVADPFEQQDLAGLEASGPVLFRFRALDSDEAFVVAGG